MRNPYLLAGTPASRSRSRSRRTWDTFTPGQKVLLAGVIVVTFPVWIVVYFVKAI